MRVQLPNGLLDGADLFNYAQVDELRGKQQNYLADRELVMANIGHIPKILTDCVLSLETKEGLAWKGQMSDAIEKLSVGDIETLLIKVRENTYGERFYFEATCPHCEAVNKNLRLDLDKLELDVLSVEEMVKQGRLVFKLPKSGKEVEVKPLYLKDLFESLKVAKNKTNELVTSVIAMSLKRIDTNMKPTAKDVEDLPARDIMALSKHLEKIKIEGTIDTKIEQDCTKCGKEFETKLDVYSSDFFDPTRVSPATTT